MSLIDKNSRILVTGASGYLGSNILKHLNKAGYSKLTGLSRNAPDRTAFDFEVKWEETDILDVLGLEDAFEHQDVIIHAAGMVSYQPQDKAKLFKANMTGTANAVNCALTKNIKHFIHISSTAASGIPEHPQTITEKYLPDPSQFLTDYALSKWYAELEVWRGAREGLRTAILCPSIIIGNSTKQKNTDIFIRKIKDGLTKSPTGSTGLVHHDDVCRAVLLMLSHAVEDKKYIVSAGNITWQTFFSAIAKELNIGQNYRLVSKTEIKLLGLYNLVRKLFRQTSGIPTAYARQMMQSLKYDGSLISKELEFKYTDLTSAIADYCKKS